MSLSSLLVGFAVAYVVYTAIYRLRFHPLAGFPGPFWARLTTIPSYWHTLKQDRHVWLYQLQEEYGQYHLPRPSMFADINPELPWVHTLQLGFQIPVTSATIV